MNPKTFRDHISNQCGFNKAKQGEVNAVQVCSAGEWPEDHGGNWTPDRIAANHAFSDWLDQQGDSLPLPSSFSEWCEQNNDSKQQGEIEKDYEPEQAYGTAHDIQEHIRYGGTREDY